MSDEKPKRGRAEAVRGAVSGVGQSVSDRVRQQLDAAGGEGDSASAREAAAKAVRGLAGDVGKGFAERMRQQLEAPGADGQPQSAKDLAAAAVRGLVGDVGQTVSDRVKQGIDAVTPDDGAEPAKRAAIALGGLVSGVGQSVSDLVRQEIGSARSEALASAKAAARGAGLLGAATATGNTAVLFAGVALWRGLGNRIGFARSALVVTAVSGAATAVLASKGVTELAQVRSSTRAARRGEPTIPPTAATPGARRAPRPSSGADRAPERDPGTQR